MVGVDFMKATHPLPQAGRKAQEGLGTYMAWMNSSGILEEAVDKAIAWE